MNNFITILGALLLASSALGQSCANPKFSDVKTHVTMDTKLNTETAYTVEFKVECGPIKSIPFYAEVDGVFIASSCDHTGQKYQFSWTADHKTAPAGDIELQVFDETGFFNIKKLQRNNEDASKVKPVKSFTFNHKANYRGPYLQSELVALVLFGSIFYVASSARSCIQA